MDFFKSLFGSTRTSASSSIGSYSAAAATFSGARSSHGSSDSQPLPAKSHFQSHSHLLSLSNDTSFGDDDVGKQLDRLWSAFEGAEGSSDSLLKEFLEVFASRYDWRCLSHWEHGPLQELEHDVEHEFYEHVVHPTLVIMGLKTELQQFGARLHQELLTACERRTPLSRADVQWSVLDLMEICTRFRHDRQILERTTLAHCLSELRGALLARLEELISEDDQYDSLEVVAIAFEKLARITVNFGADEMLDTINEAVDHIICFVSRLQERRNGFRPRSSCVELEGRLYLQLSVLIQHSDVALDAFRDSDGLAVVLHCIGKEPDSGASEGARQTLFYTQLSALKLLRHTLCASSAAIAAVASMGGFHRICSFVRWLAHSFVASRRPVHVALWLGESLVSDRSTPPLPDWLDISRRPLAVHDGGTFRFKQRFQMCSDHLHLLFEQLFLLCTSARASQAHMVRALIVLLCSPRDDGDASPSSAETASSAPTGRDVMQQYCVSFLSLLVRDSASVALLRQLHISKKIFSPEMFFANCNAPPRYLTGRARKGAVVGKPEKFHLDPSNGNDATMGDAVGTYDGIDFDTIRLQDGDFLRLQLLEFVTFICTFDNGDNSDLLGALLDCLQFESGSELILLFVCRSLTAVLRLRHRSSVAALLSLNALSRITTMALTYSSKSLQRALLRCLDYLVVLEPTRLQLLGTSLVTIDNLFLLVERDADLQRFAVRLLVSFIVLGERQHSMAAESESAQDLSSLLRKYVELLSRSSPGATAVLLDGVRSLAETSPEMQTWLCSCSVFLQLMSVLNVYEDAQLCLHVLRALQALLFNNPKNRALFLCELSYQELADLIVRCQGSAAPPSPEVFDVLLHMLKDSEENNAISNPDVLFVLLRLVWLRDQHEQIALLTTLQSLACSCMLNRIHMTSLRLQDILLSHFSASPLSVQERLLSLLRVLGKHSFDVRQLRLALQLMTESPNSASNARLLASLRQMISPRPYSSFFYFDGVNSGLRLPVLWRWPQRAGYRIHTAIRLEASSGSMTLFSALTRDGRGVELFVNGRRLVVRVCLSRGRIHESKQTLELPLQKWVNLKVSHSTARALSRAQLRVHLDDELIGKEMLPYPALKDPLTLCHIGTNEQAQTVFCGQMAHFSLQEELDSVVFALDPRASESDLFLDVSSREEMHARRLPGTHRCITIDIRDSLYCLGGVNCLLPFFAELSGLSQCQSQVLEQLLHLLRAQLEHNSDTARQLDSFGFGVIVHLLSSMSAAHMTVPVVDALSALALSRPSAAARHLMRLDLYLPASDSVHQRWLTALQTHRWPPQILVDLIVDATHPLPTDMLHKLLGMFSADGVEVLMRALFYSSDAALRVAIASTLTRLVEERPTHCKELLPPILFLALLESEHTASAGLACAGALELGHQASLLLPPSFLEASCVASASVYQSLIALLVEERGRRRRTIVLQELRCAQAFKPLITAARHSQRAFEDLVLHGSAHAAAFASAVPLWPVTTLDLLTAETLQGLVHLSSSVLMALPDTSKQGTFQDLLAAASCSPLGVRFVLSLMSRVDCCHREPLLHLLRCFSLSACCRSLQDGIALWQAFRERTLNHLCALLTVAPPTQPCTDLDHLLTCVKAEPHVPHHHHHHHHQHRRMLTPKSGQLSDAEARQQCVCLLLEHCMQHSLSIAKIEALFPAELSLMFPPSSTSAVTGTYHFSEKKLAVELQALEVAVGLEKESYMELHEFRNSVASVKERQAVELVQAEQERLAERSKVHEHLKGFVEKERLRRLVHDRNTKEFDKLYAKRWNVISRDLAHERVASGSSTARRFWRLGRAETRLRMRMKLLIDYDGTDHADATADVVTQSEEQAGDQTGVGEICRSAIKELSEHGTEAEAEAEDELNAMSELLLSEARLASASIVSGAGEDRSVCRVDARLISPTNTRNGVLDLTTRFLYFVADVSSDAMVGESPGVRLLGVGDRKWTLADIRETNWLFSFESSKVRRKLYTRLLSLGTRLLPSLMSCQSSVPSICFHKSDLRQRWQRGEISNFEYLMRLNTIAGRTYNDLTQYPIFPWVIADYSSPTLDLADPSIYRDLSKPVGALNPDRLVAFQQRYRNFTDPVIPPFHYGTHYSTAGSVLFYLIRLEPFTSCALSLQENHFDHADRLFYSIPATWTGCLENPADVKELIPEFFYLPDFLRNLNGYNLGTRQTGEVVSDVVLPPWASSPEQFIRIQREALESEYVSRNLHHWIDLVFGYKQRGKEAVKANNVFFHLTYEGGVDIDAIEDPILREATIEQINHFGQTPSQLLTSAHPARLEATDRATSLLQEEAEHIKLHVNVLVAPPPPLSDTIVFVDNPVVFISCLSSNRVLTLSLDRHISIHKWKPSSVGPFLFEVDKGDRKRKISQHFERGATVRSSMFAVSSDSRVLLSCAHFDNEFRVSSLDSGRKLQSISEHRYTVSSLALDGQDTELVATASRDSTVCVWELEKSSRSRYLQETPLHVLRGHHDEVLSVAISCDFDVVVSGSKDGSCLLHSARSGCYIRTLRPLEGEGPIEWVGISCFDGSIAVYTSHNLTISIFTINGRLLRSWSSGERLFALCFSHDGKFLITGGDRRRVVINSVHHERLVHRFPPLASRIRSICESPTQQQLLVGLQCGHLVVYALDNSLGGGTSKRLNLSFSRVQCAQKTI